VGPAENGGLPVRKYAVQYKEERKDWRDARNKTWPVGMYILCSKVWYIVVIQVCKCERNLIVVLKFLLCIFVKRETGLWYQIFVAVYHNTYHIRRQMFMKG
jgi:hypothetical protein